MNESEIKELTQVIKVLAIRLNEPVVPLDQKAWNASQCAAYLNRSVSSFLQKVAPLPTFPRATKYQTSTGESHREWRAQDVIDWNMKRFG